MPTIIALTPRQVAPVAVGGGAFSVTLVVTEAWLLAATGSPWSPLTVAVLVTDPAFCGVTLRVIVALLIFAVAPAFRVPIAQISFCPCKPQLPAVVVAEAYLTLFGSGSVTVTPVAVSGPRSQCRLHARIFAPNCFDQGRIRIVVTESSARRCKRRIG